MKTYSVYQDSGIEWVGGIPTHWDVLKLKRVASIVNGSTPKSSIPEYWVGNIVWVTPFDLGILNGKMTIADSARKITQVGLDSCGASVTPIGSIILSTRAPIGHLAITQMQSCTNQGCKTIVPDFRQVDNRYIFYFLLAFKNILQSMGQGSTFTELSSQNLKNFTIIFPTHPEQQAIADFLDHKTAQIDELIAKKQRQIELLQEHRTALINQAVTKGLNPDAPMKDSGKIFFQKIPKHWTITRLGYICEQIADGPHYSPEYVDDGIMFLSARNVKIDRWELESAKYITEEEYKKISKRIIPRKGDVLYTKGGTTGVARVVDFDEPFQVWVHIIVLKVKNEKVSPDYLAYSLNSPGCYDQSQLLTRGATNNDLGVTRVPNITLLLPPLQEQIRIVHFLKKQTEKIDKHIKQLKKNIEQIQEFRTALISAAVTGKIDVRGEGS